jgi:hypothetical protein
MQRIAQKAENILNDVEIFENISEQIEMDGNMWEKMCCVQPYQELWTLCNRQAVQIAYPR